MPVQPNALPATQTLTYPTSTPDGTTIRGNNRQDKANQPWTLQLTASQNYNLTNGAETAIGWQNRIINTYKAVSKIYSLRFLPATLGGNVFAYTSIIVPQYGTYELNLKILASVVSGSPASTDFAYLDIAVNGTHRFYSDISVYANTILSPQMVELTILNPNDAVTMAIFISSSTGTYAPVVGLDYCRFNLRYLGLN